MKTTIHRTSNGWAFVISNGAQYPRTVSDGYRTRAQAQDAVKDIKQGIRNNQNKT